MPEISRFFGIIIRMYYNDHLPPHFHAEYEKYEASINVLNLDTLEGHLPRRVRNLVIEWAIEHRAELMENWEKARESTPLKKISPLE